VLPLPVRTGPLSSEERRRVPGYPEWISPTVLNAGPQKTGSISSEDVSAQIINPDNEILLCVVGSINITAIGTLRIEVNRDSRMAGALLYRRAVHVLDANDVGRTSCVLA